MIPAGTVGRSGSDGSRATRLLYDVAIGPRPAGSSAERLAQSACEGELRDLGFDVVRAPFSYSRFPGEFGTPLGGAVAIAAFLISGHVAHAGHPELALAVLLAAGALLAIGGSWLTSTGVLDLPVMRATGDNLVAQRPGLEPRVWMVAHTDSKSQPISLLVRAVGATATGMVALASAITAAAQWRGMAWAHALWPYLTVAGALAATPLLFSLVGSRGEGALDNASGAAAVVLAAASIPVGVPVGVLLTSAEELGLAGARAWARTRSGVVALNCDGIDDEGMLTVMWSGRRPDLLIGALVAAAEREREPLRVMRLPPGILVDAVALQHDSGESATLARGTLRSLRRVHSSSDTRANLRGIGIAAAARILSAAATELALES